MLHFSPLNELFRSLFTDYGLNRRLDGIKYLDTGKPEWIEMKPILDVVNEALKSAGKS